MSKDSQAVRRRWVRLALVLFVSASPRGARAQADYDSHQFTTELVWRGDQALTMCNGLFVSGRTPDQVMRQELASLLYGNRDGLRPYDPMPLDQVSLDYDRRTVAYGIGSPRTAPIMRAAYREGLGCVIMGPDQDFRDVSGLPELHLPPFERDAETIPWPDGDLVEDRPPPADVDARVLDAAGDWVFDREAHGGYEGQVTTGLLVVYQGHIVYERYAPGFDRTTRIRTWSTAKSIASVVIGVGAGKGLVELDDPLPVEWLPASDAPGPDVRKGITLRHVLNMSSGLYPVDNEWQPVRGSHLVYFGGWDGSTVPRDRGLLYEPGTVWDYENFDILLGLLTLKIGIGDAQAFLKFPHTELFRRIGMRSTVPGVDRFGNYIMSSQVYTNARDLARMGLLLLDRGRWHGRQVLPESWVDFIRTPAPATVATGRQYGGAWWLPPDDRTDVPQDAFASSGSQGNYTIVVPSYDLVVVRRGLDWEDRGLDLRMNRWDVLAQILEAFPEREGAHKLEAPPMEGGYGPATPR
jgi:CubicO group peptidase (beta-lactamase class C family)